jgi:hypothetical protein
MGRKLLPDEIRLGTQLFDKKWFGFDAEGRMLEPAAEPSQSQLRNGDAQ